MTPAEKNSDDGETQLHIVFVVDTTGSMGTYLEALKQALVQVNALLQVLFPANADVSIITYADYSDKELTRKIIQGSHECLAKFCAVLKAQGGFDLAEATKTALNILIKQLKEWKNDKTIVFHYTDAPPHHRLTNPSGSNRPKEMRALAEAKPGYDWCQISKRFRRISSRVKMFTIVPKDSPAGGCGAAFYTLLGELIALPVVQANEITGTTMSILLQLIGQTAELTGCERVLFRDEAVYNRLVDQDNNEDEFPELNTAAYMEPPFRPSLKNTAHLVWSVGFTYPNIPEIQRDLALLRPRFKQDENFRDIVFHTMATLLTPQNVMALTTNEIFGRLWRLVCTCRDDTRLTSLVAKMGECSGSKLLNEIESFRLRTWLEDSYDNAEEINAAIAKEERDCKHYYVMDTFAQHYIPDVDGLRSLGRAPSSVALANVQKILAHIIVVDNGLPVDEKGNRLYLPVTLDDYRLFTMLPHLMRPGSHFSLKPAAMLAMLCCKNTDSLLFDRAQRFLVAIRGKWLPPVDRIDRAEILSYEFSSLMATSCHNVECLTDEEKAFFVRLHEIWRYRRARFQNFEVSTPLSPEKPLLLPDFKTKCRRCREWTSTTLMDSKSVCGICLWKAESPLNKWSRPRSGEDYFVTEVESYIVECVCCRALYAVLGPGDLNILPKCHYCRGLDKFRRSQLGAPYRRCGCCRAKWCHPALGENDESGSYLCAVCTTAGAGEGSQVPSASTKIYNPCLSEIVEQNPMWVTQLGFRKMAASIVFSSHKISQVVIEHRDVLFLPPREDAQVPELMFQNRTVLNEDELLERVKLTVASASFVGTCQLCFEEMAVEKLRLACGYCTNRCCHSCLKSWYNQNAPGKVFIPSHDMCPFCRNRPQYAVLREYNHQACGIIGLSRRKGNALRLRADWYYGWCRGCWKVAYALGRTCSEGVPEFSDFECEECEERKQIRRIAEEHKDADRRTELLLKDTKGCPGCGILTSHLGGCSHMTCGKCGIHWCWACVSFKASIGRDVYEHMRQVHGGYAWVEDTN